MKRLLVALVVTWLPVAAPAATALVADHHQHIFGPGVTALIGGDFREVSVDDVVSHLDHAGIERGVLLSAAYIYSDPRRAIEEPRESRAAFGKITLTEQEVERIAANVAPYLR